MSGPHEPKQGGVGWRVALLALPVLCCAGPAQLAVLGAGSIGALLGGAVGTVVLASGLAVACVALAVFARGRRARR